MKKNDFSFKQNFILKKIEKQQGEYVAIFEKQKTKEMIKAKVNDILEVDENLKYQILDIEKNKVKIKNLLNEDEFVLKLGLSKVECIIIFISVFLVFTAIIVTFYNEKKSSLNNNRKIKQYSQIENKNQSKILIKKIEDKQTKKKIESNSQLIKKLEAENEKLKKELNILENEVNKNKKKLESEKIKSSKKSSDKNEKELTVIEKKIHILNKDISDIKNNLKSLNNKETSNEKAINELYSNILNNLSKIVKNQSNLSMKNQTEIKKLKVLYTNLLQTNKKLIEANIEQMKKIKKLLKKIETINNEKIREQEKTVLNTYKIPFYFIGTTTENGQIYAYISSLTNQIYKVAKGDVINNKYKVIDINKQRMILENIINNKLILLKLKQGR